MRVIFVRHFVHLAIHFLRATGVKHVLAELFVSDEERVDSGGSRFSESNHERWHSAILFTVECGSSGMLKSMSST